MSFKSCMPSLLLHKNALEGMLVEHGLVGGTELSEQPVTRPVLLLSSA